MKKVKKVISLTLVTAMAVSAAAGCGAKGEKR